MCQTLFQFMLVIIAAWFGYIIFDFLGIPAAALTGATSAVTVVALSGKIAQCNDFAFGH